MRIKMSFYLLTNNQTSKTYQVNQNIHQRTFLRSFAFVHTNQKIIQKLILRLIALDAQFYYTLLFDLNDVRTSHPYFFKESFWLPMRQGVACLCDNKLFWVLLGALKKVMVQLLFLFISKYYRMPRYQKQEKTPPKNVASQQQDSGASSKITIHFPSQVQHYDEDDNTNPVTIYLRFATKKSFKVQVPSKISIPQIKQLALSKMSIRKDKQILHLNGKNVTEYGYIRLQPNNIIHVTNSDDLFHNQEEIQIKVKIIDSFLQNKVQNKIYKIKANQNISTIIDSVKKQKEKSSDIQYQAAFYFLLESSRILEKDKSFSEQDIPKNAQIICLITKHELKTRFSNDTKEEILHDISQLLGFEEDSQPYAKKEETQNRPRYREERRNSDTQDDQPYIVRVKEIPEPTEEEQFNLLKAESTPNFKKKKQQMSKTFSCQTPQRPLATKIKASKSKKQIQQLLKSQEKPGKIFETPEVVKTTIDSPIKQSKQSQMQIHKPAPSIPKVMPAQQRRKIRLEIQKLFDFGGNENEVQAIPQVKQQQKPKSPPTEQPYRPPEKQKQKLRFSMGSRPAFLDQLKFSQK